VLTCTVVLGRGTVSSTGYRGTLVPLHAMKAFRGSRGTTHSHPQYQLEVSSQLGVPAALPAGKDRDVSTY
jgi:hypothetical protein